MVPNPYEPPTTPLLIVVTLGPPALAAVWFVGPATLLAPLLVIVLAAWSEI
jgi:hypothetical protein